jgi:hypothetical protein
LGVIVKLLKLEWQIGSPTPLDMLSQQEDLLME